MITLPSGAGSDLTLPLAVGSSAKSMYSPASICAATFLETEGSPWPRDKGGVVAGSTAAGRIWPSDVRLLRSWLNDGRQGWGLGLDSMRGGGVGSVSRE